MKPRHWDTCGARRDLARLGKVGEVILDTVLVAAVVCGSAYLAAMLTWALR